MWEPWIGKHFDATRLLLLGESAYDWDENGVLVSPSDDHCIKLVCEVVKDFEGCCRRKDGNGFMVKLSRALTGEERPTQAQLQYAWDRVAFTNYVPQTVGKGARVRPLPELWDAAQREFRQILIKVDPDRIIVLGKDMWARMPGTKVSSGHETQSYKKPNDKMACCYAVKHPSAGLSWRELEVPIRFACRNILREA